MKVVLAIGAVAGAGALVIYCIGFVVGRFYEAVSKLSKDLDRARWILARKSVA